MVALRVLLVVMFTVMSVYTALVVMDHGLNLLPVFFGDIARMGWPGQFNLDFLAFLMFSALWLAWRHHFSPSGIALGVGGLLLGAPYLCVYLLIQSLRVDGDVRVLLLGPERARATTPCS